MVLRPCRPYPVKWLSHTHTHTHTHTQVSAQVQFRAKHGVTSVLSLSGKAAELFSALLHTHTYGERQAQTGLIWWSSTRGQPSHATTGPEVLFIAGDRLVGFVIKASASRSKDPGFESRFLQGKFSGSSHATVTWSGTPVVSLSGAWRCRVSARSGWHRVSILWLDVIESLICNLYLRVGWDRKFDLPPLSPCGSTCTRLSRFDPEIH